MKILFSPSETKTTLCVNAPLNQSSFIFPELYTKRHEVLTRYQRFVDSASLTALSRLFGLKDLAHYEKTNLFEAQTCKAIERYSGVAYDYLDYTSLDTSSQEYLDNNVMIFSNLFGPLLAKDALPLYKLHQGEAIEGFKPEGFYKEAFSNAIDDWIADEPLLDLRAHFYEKFYQPKNAYMSMKFLKGGKVVSHFAKAYRGVILRRIAQLRPNSEEALQHIEFENLRIVEIHRKKLMQEYVYEIIE